ncbi:hypothetical protein A7U60_g3152 [Sanghuangporus baumii]|uniref:Uncharacterized protein n=1 Tax=Sanghuangporus baumii TaxID=108892 RepID=A0A9Q5I1C5_SANBA|nr:hypothetical protein A7U60_g3152 [Sanghuangporus baumii]
MDSDPSTISDQTNETVRPINETTDNTDEPQIPCVASTPQSIALRYNEAERFPIFKKMRREHRLIDELTSAFESEEFTQLRNFGDSLAVVARYIAELELESKERSPFHHKIALITVSKIFGKHEARYERRTASIFNVLHRAVASSSNKELEVTLYVLSALFVLAGPLVFTRPKSLKLLHRIFNCIPNRRSSRLDKLRFLTVQCLLWSFSHIIVWGVTASTVWWNALAILGPHLNVDEAPELLSCLLNSKHHAETDGCEFHGAKLASMTVLTLIERRQDEQSRVFSLKLLHRLLTCGLDDWPDAPNKLASDNFLKVDTLINNAKSENFSEVANERHALRTLSLREINVAWDFLASAWYLVVRTEVNNAPRGKMKLTRKSIEMWRVLLRTYGNIEDAIEVICDAHVKLVLGSRNKHGKRGMDIPLFHAIQAATQLWLVTTDKLEISARSTVAEMILLKLLERRDIYGHFEGTRQASWFKLIEELLFCDPLRALAAISAIRGNSDEKPLVQQQVWCDVMHYIVVPEVGAAGVKSHFSISELVEFLRFPYKMEFKAMDDYAHLLWDTIFGKTFEIAQERRRSSIVIELMEEVAREFGVKVKEGITEKIRQEEDVFYDADRSRRPRPKLSGRGRQ